MMHEQSTQHKRSLNGSKDTRSERDFLVPPLSDEVVDFCFTFTAMLQNAEPQFIEIGEYLQTIYETINMLTKKVMGAGSLLKDEADQGGLSNSGEIVAQMLAGLTGCRKEIDDHLQSVGMISEYLNEMDRYRGQIEIIAKHLRAVGLNMMIESARSLEMEQKFNIIATEVKQLSETVNLFIRDMEEYSQDAMMNLNHVFRTITNSRNTISGLIDNAREEAEKSVKETEQLMDASLSILEHAEKHSKAISAQVGEVVMGLQYYDNMKQQGETIVANLLEIFTRYFGNQMATDSEPLSPDKYEDVYATIHSQLTALRRIHHNLEMVYRKNDQAFLTIGKTVKELNERIEKLAVTEKDTNLFGILFREGNPFIRLVGVLTHLKQLLAKIAELIFELRGGTKKAAEKTGTLLLQVEKVGEISAETSRKALNAIIAAGGLGERGQTLNALSNEMKDLAGSSRKYVIDMEAVLKIAETAIRDLEDRMAKDLETADADSCRVGLLDDVIHNIDSVHKSFSENADAANHYVHELTDKLGRVTVSLDFFPTLAAELDAHVRKLTDIMNRFGANVSKAFKKRIADSVVPAESAPLKSPHNHPAENNGGRKEMVVEEMNDEEEIFDDNIELF